jgi:beta-galactosidase
VVEAAEDGWPALVAAGRLHYLAGWPDEAALTRILTRACAAEGIEVDTLPEGLRRRDTATHRFMFNYNSVAAEWGGVTIPPAGVHWTAR